MLHGQLTPTPGTGGDIGLRAAVGVPAGTVVWFPCPQCPQWTPDERAPLPGDVLSRLDSWGYPLRDGTLLVPCSGANMMNHSCLPTVLDLGLDFGVAVTDIPAGTEVTVDYGTFDTVDERSMPCACGAAACRGTISTLDVADPRLRADWTARMAPALTALREVPQPLGAFLARCSPTYRALCDGADPADLDLGHSVVAPGFRAR